MTGLRRLRVVIAGGGVAALETAIALRTLAPELVDITLVAPTDRFRFRAASVGEPFGRAEVHRFDLTSICADIGVTLRCGALTAVAPDERAATIGDDERIEFDALVVACGAEARPVVPGALGLMAGFWLQDRIETFRFRRIVVFAIFALGANLAVKGLWK